MKDWAQGTCDVDNMALRYFRSGGAHPPLVLVHGFTDNALYFSRAAHVLASSWDVVAYDCRGHGKSSRANGFFSATDRVDDLLAVIDLLDLERPAMMGHSMGAATIANAIVRRPGLSRGIVLEDPAWWESPAAWSPEAKTRFEQEARLRNSAWQDSIAAVQKGTWEEGLRWRRTDCPSWTDEDVALSLQARLEVELDVFTYLPSVRSTWRDSVPRFDCPTLLVLGENERGAIVSLSDADEAARLNPMLRWVQIAGAGHAIRYDQFALFMQASLAFLGELPTDSQQ